MNNNLKSQTLEYSTKVDPSLGEGNSSQEVQSKQGTQPNTFVFEHMGKTSAVQVKNKGVNLEETKKPLNGFMVEFSDLVKSEGLYPDMELLITSGNDGKHVEGSKHYKGLAIDLRIPSSYRKDKASVYKSPQWQVFQNPKVKSLMNEWGVGVLDPLHYKLDTEEKTLQNAHIHLEFLGGGHYVGDGHDHSPNETIEGPTEGLKVEDVPEGSFEGELEFELMLEELERKQAEEVSKKNTEKQLLKNTIISKIQGLKEFAKPIQKDDEQFAIRPSSSELPLNSLDGTSIIPQELIGLR